MTLRRNHVIVSAVAAMVLLAACSKSSTTTATAPLPSQAGGASVTGTPPASDSGSGTGSGQGKDGGGGSGSVSGSDGHATDDDQRVFGYATTDETAIAAQTSTVSSQISQLANDAGAHNLGAVESDAQALLNSSKKLGHQADRGVNHQQPLKPTDGDLKKARGDALDAFGLTADYANTAVSLASALTSASLTELATAANQVVALSGTSSQLESSYEHLNTELANWAAAHPVDAAAALKHYA
jgi:hypothetical protein